MPTKSTYPVSKPLSRLVKSGVLGVRDVNAAIEIECAVLSILTHGIRSNADDRPEDSLWRDEGDAPLMRFFEARQAYYDWIDAMQAAGLSAGPVLDVIVEGKPLHLVDKSRCRRKGWTRKLVKQSLTLFQLVSQVRRDKTSRLTA